MLLKNSSLIPASTQILSPGGVNGSVVGDVFGTVVGAVVGAAVGAVVGADVVVSFGAGG